MINQHQFQQAAKHYRSGRISLSEFQSLAAAGIETKTGKSDPLQKQDAAIVIKRGDTMEVLVDILDQLKSAGQNFLATGVGDALGAQLSQQISDGRFDSATQTFTCNKGSNKSVPNETLALIAVADVDAEFRSGYLAAIIARDSA